MQLLPWGHCPQAAGMSGTWAHEWGAHDVGLWQGYFVHPEYHQGAIILILIGHVALVVNGSCAQAWLCAAIRGWRHAC